MVDPQAAGHQQQLAQARLVRAEGEVGHDAVERGAAPGENVRAGAFARRPAGQRGQHVPQRITVVECVHRPERLAPQALEDVPRRRLDQPGQPGRGEVQASVGVDQVEHSPAPGGHAFVFAVCGLALGRCRRPAGGRVDAGVTTGVPICCAGRTRGGCVDGVPSGSTRSWPVSSRATGSPVSRRLPPSASWATYLRTPGREGDRNAGDEGAPGSRPSTTRASEPSEAAKPPPAATTPSTTELPSRPTSQPEEAGRATGRSSSEVYDVPAGGGPGASTARTQSECRSATASTTRSAPAGSSPPTASSSRCHPSSTRDHGAHGTCGVAQHGGERGGGSVPATWAQTHSGATSARRRLSR